MSELVVRQTALPGVLIVGTKRLGDERGWFAEVHHRERYAAVGLGMEFVQDNAAGSRQGVLRGLHLQHPRGQVKLVRVVEGCVFDVAVDVRVGSPTFGRWTGAELSAGNGDEMLIPTGFAHGYVATSRSAILIYKCTDHYAPAHELVIRWDDPDIGVDWPVDDPVLSPRDAEAPLLSEIPDERLPRWFPGAD